MTNIQATIVAAQIWKNQKLADIVRDPSFDGFLVLLEGDDRNHYLHNDGSLACSQHGCAHPREWQIAELRSKERKLSAELRLVKADIKKLEGERFRS